ncbi:uncharacterized protein LOC134267087, partial [Saccostrea cucullata]|uniref:uncharacterized protein LOC134267087 n=1 Tax=Saccostrea cuccullata TaxID=36930 RepID=UPI002ED28CD1
MNAALEIILNMKENEQSLQSGDNEDKEEIQELWRYLDFAIGTEEDVKLRREISRVYVEVKNVSQISDEFISGSSAEGFKFQWSDLDIMWSSTKGTVVLELEGLTYSRYITFIASDIGCKPSFCKLAHYPKKCDKVSDDDCFSRIRFLEMCHKYSFNKCTDITSHGPCITSYIQKEYDVCYCFPIHPISSNKILRNFSTKFWNNLKSRLLEKRVTLMHVVPKGPTKGDVKGIQWLKSFCLHHSLHLRTEFSGIWRTILSDTVVRNLIIIKLIVRAQNIRLVNGYTAAMGRVEVKNNGAWGTVCDDDWDDIDAAVVCSMLGFSRENAVKNSAFFGQGHGSIWMDE